MRRVLSIAAIVLSLGLLTSASAWACQAYRDIVQDTQGNVLSNVTVLVYIADTTTPATLYSNKTCTAVKANPFVNQANGQVLFYAPNGRYTITMTRHNVTFGSPLDIVLTDPTSPLPGPLTVNGLIWSTSGGIKFPDNTIQTTAGGGGGSGITSLNGLVPTTQLLAVGSIGTDFNISSVGSTHTFNLPTASATVRGALSTANWTAFNNKVDPTRSISTTSPLGGGGDLSANRTLTCITCVTSVTASGNLASSGGTTPAITLTPTPSFTSATLTANTNSLVLGTTNTTTVTMAALTAPRVVTFPDANSNTIQPLTCAGTDKFSGVSAAGVFTCTADQTAGGGTGIVTLNGQVGATQSFATGTSGTDFNIVSATNTHTFNLPTASGTNRGALSSTDWTTFNAKESALTFSGPLSRAVNTISCPTCVTAVTASGNLSSTGGTTPAISITTTPTFGALTLNGTATYAIDVNSGIFTNSLRSSNASYLVWRNFAGSTDVKVLRVNASNVIELGDTTINALTLSTAGSPSYGFPNVPIAPGTTQAACFDASGYLYRASGAGCPGSGGGIVSLNALTGTIQTFAVGTTGTDFNIASSGTAHTFNIPDAGASARGVVTTGAQTFSGIKTIPGIVINGSPAVGIDVSQGTYTTAGIQLKDMDYAIRLGTVTDFGPFTSPGIVTIMRPSSTTGTALFSLRNNIGGLVFPVALTGYGQVTVGSSSVFGIHALAETTSATSGASGLEATAKNSSGVDPSASLPVNNGWGQLHPNAITASCDGTAKCTSGLFVAASPQPFLHGVVIHTSSATQTAFTDTSNAVTSHKILGSHTYGIDMFGATLTTPIRFPDGTQQTTAFISGSGITSLNGLTGATQTFAVSTTGSDFAVSSSGTAHTWNLPDASTSARGVVTAGVQTFGGDKTFNNALILSSASRFKFADASTNYTLIGQGVGTLVNHFLQPTAESGRHYAFAAQLDTAASGAGDKVAIYGAIKSGSGTSPIWAGNFLAQWSAGSPDTKTTAVEIDFNNNNSDSAPNPSTDKGGLVILSGGSFMGGWGMAIASTTSGNKWQKSLKILAGSYNTAGIEIGNPSSGLTGAIITQQMSNGGDTFIAQRATDVGPSGQLFRALNAANNTNLFYVSAADPAVAESTIISYFGAIGERRLQVGTADSGGTGYRMVRIPN